MARSMTAGGQRGFTLVEMMVALVVGAVSVIVAAKVAQVVIRQSAQGQQATDFNARSRLLGRQLRTDLRMAGFGSTGAIAVDDSNPPWNAGIAVSINGKSAIAAVTGANRIAGGNIGGTAILPNSDAMMVVVPNPGLAGVSVDWAAAGTSGITLGILPSNPGVQPLTNCATGYVYVVDHTAPNGAGRAQVATLTSVVGNGVALGDELQFTMAPGSSVMCARVSTYWVDDSGWLHRTDFGPGPNAVGVQDLVFADANQVGNDQIVPGVLDLQIAYRFSSEVYVNLGLPIPPAANMAAQWAYEGNAQNVDPMLVGGPINQQNWFEVRRVRLNALLSTIRRVDARTSSTKQRTTREDSIAVTVDRPLRVEWVTTSETLTNLRFFDHGAPSGVRPEPF